jgi:flagellar operon protein
VPDIDGVSLPFLPAGGVEQLRRPPAMPGSKEPATPFDEVFKEELGRVKFSGHAQSRLVGRDISIDEADMQKLDSAISAAGEKGAKETLVLMPEKAFIVSIPNKTVITALNREAMDMNIVTNIDSAVFTK